MNEMSNDSESVDQPTNEGQMKSCGSSWLDPEARGRRGDTAGDANSFSKVFG